MRRTKKQSRKTQELTRRLERDALVALVEMQAATDVPDMLIQQYKL